MPLLVVRKNLSHMGSDQITVRLSILTIPNHPPDITDKFVEECLLLRNGARYIIESSDWDDMNIMRQLIASENTVIFHSMWG